MLKRIVSRGHSSPKGFWYDQEENEFVLVVRRSAGLKLENEDDIVVLKTGDYLNEVYKNTLRLDSGHFVRIHLIG